MGIKALGVVLAFILGFAIAYRPFGVGPKVASILGELATNMKQDMTPPAASGREAPPEPQKLELGTPSEDIPEDTPGATEESGADAEKAAPPPAAKRQPASLEYALTILDSIQKSTNTASKPPQDGGQDGEQGGSAEGIDR